MTVTGQAQAGNCLYNPCPLIDELSLRTRLVKPDQVAGADDQAVCASHCNICL